jgi:hypothetical protein
MRQGIEGVDAEVRAAMLQELEQGREEPFTFSPEFNRPARCPLDAGYAGVEGSDQPWGRPGSDPSQGLCGNRSDTLVGVV